jgi:hypothetical protein
MTAKGFSSMLKVYGSNFLSLIFSVVVLAGFSSGQTIPGTLTDVKKTTTTVNGTCTILTTTYTWTFTDSATNTAHGFPSPSMLTSYLSANHSCYGNVVSPANEWSSDGLYYLQGTVGSATEESVTLARGYISPKYKVVGIAYTVPGEQSYVQYTDTTMMGSGSSTSSSFSTDVSTSTSICGSTGGDVCGKSSSGVAITGTYTNSFTMESDSSSSWATNQTTSFVNKLVPLTGPALDHGNDIVYVWVNPNVWYTVTPANGSGPAPLQWDGYTFDLLDDSNNMEVIPLRLSELLNPSTIDAYTLGRLKRSWAQPNTDGSGPGITNQDLLTIAGTDPFSNSSYAVVIGSDGKTTTDLRFTQTTNGELWYLPGQTNVYNWSYTSTDTEGQGGKTTYSHGFSLEEKFQSDWIIGGLSYDLKQSTTFTWVDQWTSTRTQMTGQTAAVSITGPTGSYTGPDEFNVYQDNVYGTFMVNPVPPQ